MIDQALLFASMGGGGGVYARNMVAPNLPNWIVARNAAKAASGSALISTIGDSRVSGQGAGNGDAYTNARYRGPSTVLANRLNALGVPAASKSLLGTGRGTNLVDSATFCGGNVATANTGWIISTVSSFGVNMFRGQGTGTMTLTTPAACTDIDIVYPTNTTPLGTFTYNIDGGAESGVISENFAISMTKITVSGLANTVHTVQFTWVSGVVFIEGIICRNAATPTINILNGGYGGATTATWIGTNTTFDPMNVSMYLAPKLTIIQLGTNESSVSTLQTGLTNLITKAKTTGDCMLLVPGPTSVGNWQAIQAQVRDMMYALSDSQRVGLVDFFTLNGSWEAMNAAGKEFDTTHENVAGYTQEWNLVAEMLAAV